MGARMQSWILNIARSCRKVGILPAVGDGGDDCHDPPSAMLSCMVLWYRGIVVLRGVDYDGGFVDSCSGCSSMRYRSTLTPCMFRGATDGPTVLS